MQRTFKLARAFAVKLRSQDVNELKARAAAASTTRTGERARTYSTTRSRCPDSATGASTTRAARGPRTLAFFTEVTFAQ
ncbi:hypothetical protein AWC19_06330 [Mycobacterium palustre]|uniref:Uncharacterized protein n=1 Tax=Mycobacterium palustre TaxID=153971 RepID=A0A1X1ZR07_9MYCO|nr:hypothetical protein AWC19_06330 [Mycobacterium palustre]